MTVYLNGTFVDEADARLSVCERGFLYGEGLFETLAVYNGRPFRLERHLDRLRASGSTLDIPVPLQNDSTAEIVASLLEQNGLVDAYVRVTVTSGTAPGMVPRQQGEPTVLVIAGQPRIYPPELYETGARAVTSPYYLGPLSCHKTLSYLPNTRARARAVSSGANEAILFDRGGNPAEGSASNIYIVREGTVVTPPLDSGILPGVTREEVLRICAAEGIPVEERIILLDQLRSADEMFLTNTLMKVMPVGSIDDVSYPADRPVTTRLAGLYNELLNQ